MNHAPAGLLLLLFTSGLAAATARAESTVPAARWLAAYEQAWESRNADAAAALFSEDARYFETPWAEPFIGQDGVRDYWNRVTADQRDVDFQWSLISAGPEVSVAHWTARFDLASNGVTVALDGVFVLSFDDEGRCTELREWWHAK